MSPRVAFYDIPPEGRLPLFVRLAEAALRKDKRLLVHCADPSEARAIDDHLWTYQDESFLPHELVDPGAAPRDPRARVVIVTTEGRPGPADVLIQATPTSEAFARTFESVVDLVDHRDPERLDASRARFRAWRDAGITPEYHKS